MSPLKLMYDKASRALYLCCLFVLIRRCEKPQSWYRGFQLRPVAHLPIDIPWCYLFVQKVRMHRPDSISQSRTASPLSVSASIRTKTYCFPHPKRIQLFLCLYIPYSNFIANRYRPLPVCTKGTSLMSSM